MHDKITRTAVQHGFQLNSTIHDSHGDHRSDDDDEDSEYDGNEETALESFLTSLDTDDPNHDEYIIFKEVIQSKYLKKSYTWLKIKRVSKYVLKSRYVSF